MIRYLKKDEYGTCIPLWKEAFPEDSEAFVNYYFGKKVVGSRVIVKEREDGKLQAMAHLNPYKVRVRDREFTLPYIVGVATAANSRRQGHMRDILVEALRDMHESHAPFCYLMPASPDIYRPFGFVYISDQPAWLLREDVAAEARAVKLRLVEEGDGEDGGGPCKSGTHGSGTCGAGRYGTGTSGTWQMDLAGWMNRWLSRHFQVYAERDRAYLAMLQAELDSEGGRVYGYLDKQGNLAALQAFWGMEKQEQRLLYCDKDGWIQVPEGHLASKPAIMARITDVAAMAEAITVNEDCPCPRMEVLLRIRDRLVEGNHGLWRWSLGMDGSSLERMEDFGTIEGDGDTLTSTEALELTVEQLTAWLFGYRPLDEMMEEDGREPPFWWRYVQPLEGVFLDEVV